MHLRNVMEFIQIISLFVNNSMKKNNALRDVGNWYMSASVELKSWDGKTNLCACCKITQSDRVNSYLGLQCRVNEYEIALNFERWDSAVIVYDLFEVASNFSFPCTRRQRYHFSLRRLILDSFSLLTGSCIQHYAPSKTFLAMGLNKCWNGLMAMVLMSVHVSNVSLCDFGLVWIRF